MEPLAFGADSRALASTSISRGGSLHVWEGVLGSDARPVRLFAVAPDASEAACERFERVASEWQAFTAELPCESAAVSRLVDRGATPRPWVATDPPTGVALSEVCDELSARSLAMVLADVAEVMAQARRCDLRFCRPSADGVAVAGGHQTAGVVTDWGLATAVGQRSPREPVTHLGAMVLSVSGADRTDGSGSGADGRAQLARIGRAALDADEYDSPYDVKRALLFDDRAESRPQTVSNASQNNRTLVQDHGTPTYDYGTPEADSSYDTAEADSNDDSPAQDNDRSENRPRTVSRRATLALVASSLFGLGGVTALRRDGAGSDPESPLAGATDDTLPSFDQWAVGSAAEGNTSGETAETGGDSRHSNETENSRHSGETDDGQLERHEVAPLYGNYGRDGPETAFAATVDEDRLVVEHAGGDDLHAPNVVLSGDALAGNRERRWSETMRPADEPTVSRGDTVALLVERLGTFEIRWDGEGDPITLGSFLVVPDHQVVAMD